MSGETAPAETVRVKPAPGLKVRFEEPSQGHIPEKGADVPMTVYYHRRLADGDLVRVERTQAPPREPAKKDAK